MSGTLKRTALYEDHVRLGGRIIDFGGWELPVQYPAGVMEEHLACRRSVGLFDVSHMGEVHVEGPDAEAYLNFLVTNNVSRLVDGQAQYTVMCRDHGGIVDDLLIYRRSSTRFLVVINASNVDKDVEWMKQVHAEFSRTGGKCTVENVSSQYTQIAVQGRNGLKTLQKLTSTPLDPIKYYHFAEGTVCGDIPAVLARTGYTGEDGFEVYVPWSDGPKVWNALMEAGAEFNIQPCGLGSRDTLRLEMKFPLYGNELSEKTHPLETGLGWVTKLDKPMDFKGKSAISAAKAAGVTRSLVGIKLLDRGIPRMGYPIFDMDGARLLGQITSGSQAPSLKSAIGIASIANTHAAIGSKVLVEIRGQKIPGEVIATPFYKRDY